MLTIYFKDGTKRSFENERNVLIKETMINTEIKSILTFDYNDTEHLGNPTKRTGAFFTDEMFGFCKDSKRNNFKQKVVIDVNGSEYTLKDVHSFRKLEDSSKKEAIEVATATIDDYKNLEGELTEFWFDEKTKYTRLGVSDIEIEEGLITIYTEKISGMYFLDKYNNKIPF